MSEGAKKLLKDKKVMIVSSDFADEIERLSEKIQTSQNDFMATAIELLKVALSREVVMRKPESNIEIKMPLISGIFLGSLGFVLGYYFKKEESK